MLQLFKKSIYLTKLQCLQEDRRMTLQLQIKKSMIYDQPITNSYLPNSTPTIYRCNKNSQESNKHN